MKLLGHPALIGAFALVLVVPAFAQTQTFGRDELVGTWVLAADTAQYNGRKILDFVTFNADSTWTTTRKMDDKPDGLWGLDGANAGGTGLQGQWSLIGDTLQVPKAFPMLVAVQDGKLFIEVVRKPDNVVCSVFSRFDPSMSLPPPTGTLFEPGACTKYGKR